MRTTGTTRKPGALLGAISGILLLAAAGDAVAQATQVSLQAVSTTRTIQGNTITLWVFDDLAVGGIPGTGPFSPEIAVGVGQGLEITLTNNLAVATSVIIPGQAMPEVQDAVTGLPLGTQGVTRMHGGSDVVTGLDNRIRSLTQETLPGQTLKYVWANLRPGTYLYQSGTHMTVQVQMGLYGAVTKDSALNTAYTGHAFSTAATVLYSEIDPGLHAAVANGTYGAGAVTPVIPSTTDYLPKYFLINGGLYNDLTALKTVTASGDPILIRLLNAGLQTHVPALLGGHFKVIAEDGLAYPYAKEQCSVILPAGKTKDLLLDIPANGRYPILDRRLYRTGGSAAAGGANGGLIGYIDVNIPPAVAPVATVPPAGP